MNRVPPSRRLFLRLRHGGIRWFWYALREHVAPVHPRFRPLAAQTLGGAHGLEIGGPSRLFRHRGALPAYDWVARLDNVNFAAETRWEHQLSDGGPFRFAHCKPPGRQWLREATDLHGLAAGSFDCVISSHCLEHIANPLGALAEWARVTKPGGHLLLVLPDPPYTFDHRRPVTSLDHLRADRAANTPESDTTHFAEVLGLHDLRLDPGAGSAEDFAARVGANTHTRCIHHHVFNEVLVGAALREAGWAPLAVERFAPLHLGALARKEAR